MGPDARTGRNSRRGTLAMRMLLGTICCAVVVLLGGIFLLNRKGDDSRANSETPKVASNSTKSPGKSAESALAEPPRSAGENLDAAAKLFSDEPSRSVAPSDSLEKIRADVEKLKRESLALGQRLTQEFPDSADAQALLASVYYNFNETARAKELWEQALQRDPKALDAWIGLATIAGGVGDNERVVKLSREGLSHIPKSIDLRHKLAESLNALDRPAEAIAALQDPPEVQLPDPVSQYLLGQSYSLLGEFERAKKCFEASLAIEPGDQRTYLGLATACRRLGLDEPADAALRKFEERHAALVEFENKERRMDTTMPTARTQRVAARFCRAVTNFYIKQRRLAEVEPLLRRAVALEPENAQFQIDLAHLLVQSRRAPEAASILEGLIAVHPKEANLHAMLADAQAESGRRKEAIAAAENAVRLEPGNKTFQQMLEFLKSRKK